MSKHPITEFVMWHSVSTSNIVLMISRQDGEQYRRFPKDGASVSPWQARLWSLYISRLEQAGKVRLVPFLLEGCVGWHAQRLEPEPQAEDLGQVVAQLRAEAVAQAQALAESEQREQSLQERIEDLVSEVEYYSGGWQACHESRTAALAERDRARAAAEKHQAQAQALRQELERVKMGLWDVLIPVPSEQN